MCSEKKNQYGVCFDHFEILYNFLKNHAIWICICKVMDFNLSYKIVMLYVNSEIV